MDIISTIAEMINDKYNEDPNLNILFTSPFINCGMDFDVVGNIRKRFSNLHKGFIYSCDNDFNDNGWWNNICVIGGFLNTNYLTRRFAADFFRHLFISLKDEGLMSYLIVLPDDRSAATIIEHDINFILSETCFAYFDSTKKQMDGWGVYKIDFRKMTNEEIYGGDYHKHPWWDSDDRAEMLFKVSRKFCHDLNEEYILDLSPGAGNFAKNIIFGNLDQKWNIKVLPNFKEDLTNFSFKDWLLKMEEDGFHFSLEGVDLVLTCFQVLEHIHPALIDKTLDNIKSIPHKIFITTVSLDYAREHFCVRERSWWEKKFIEHGWNSVPLEEIISKTHSIFDKYREIANKNTINGVDEEEKGLFVLIPKE